jgi:hypothetical protein
LKPLRISAPGLIWGGCHGDDEQAVFEELCQVVEEAIRIYEVEGKPLPAPTADKSERRQYAEFLL